MYFNPHEIYDWNDIIKDPTEKVAFVKRLAKNGGIPNFIKEGKESMPDVNSLPDGKFAMVVKEGGDISRRFPIDSAESTWFSQNAFTMNQKKIPLLARAKVANCLKVACEFYNVPVDPFVLSASQFALDESNFTDFDDNEAKIAQDQLTYRSKFINQFALPDEEKFPINTSYEVKQACDFFEDNHKNLDENNKAEEFAAHLKTACIKNQIKVPTLVYEYTNDYAPVKSDLLKVAFESRLEMISQYDWEDEKVENVKQAYELIAQQSEYVRPNQLVEMIKKADGEIFGIANYKHLYSPEYIVYNNDSFSKEAEMVRDFGGTEADGKLPNELKPKDSYMENQELQDKDFEAFQRKLDENPLIIKGYFAEDKEDLITSDVEQAYDLMDSDDKKILSRLIKENNLE